MSTNKPYETHDAEEPTQSSGHGQPGFDETRRATPPGIKLGMTIFLLIGLCVGLGIIYMWFQRDAKEEKPTHTATVVNTLGTLKLDLDPEDALPTPSVPEQLMFTPPPEPAPIPAPSDMNLSLLPDPIQARRLRSGLQAQTPSYQNESAASPEQHTPVFMESGSFAGKLEPLRLSPSVAGKLGDRDYLITQGTMIDCVLRPRLVSAQAGMFTCIAPTDTYSANGRVKLIDKGTKFIGFQSGGLAQGQDRIFVVWSRLETPKGVIVNLDSPGTGPLGEAGLGGHIDHHFMERFGNAIMLSLIFDISSYATSRNKSGDTISFDNTASGAEDAISKVLEHSVNIPPTLYKNQGERISILVARDLDFSKVYDLKPTR